MKVIRFYVLMINLEIQVYALGGFLLLRVWRRWKERKVGKGHNGEASLTTIILLPIESGFY